MLEFFRNFAKSKLGLGITIGFLALLMLGFASGDLSNYLGGNGAAGSGAAVASVDGDDVAAAELQQAANNALENVRQQSPLATMKALLADGGLDQLLTTLIDRKALVAFGSDIGVIASERLIGSELDKIDAFKGADGKFSETQYRQLLAQRGITDAQYRQDVVSSLVARQLLLPAEYGAAMPDDMTLRYATLLKERRIGSIALLPSAAFAGQTKPTDAQLNEFYTKRRRDFMVPEHRVIRFASFDESAIKNFAPPTDAEIAARFEANKAQYAASETRKITQLILPTEDAAKAVLAELKGGKSLEASASAKGLSAATLDAISKESLSGQSSQAIADATFAAARGSLVGPLRSTLGWHLMRVDTITGKPARTLDQVRGELVTVLTAEKRRTALTQFTVEVQEEFENGSALGDVAKRLGIEVSQTDPVLADGSVFGKPGQKAPPALAPVLGTAFGMEQGDNPEIAEVVPGKEFLLYDVATVTAEAPAPLAQIRPQLEAEYAMQQGSAAARAAADKALAATKQGGDLAQAIAGITAQIPPVDQVSMSREELVASQQQVPPPLRLLFNMASGTTKILPAPRNRGFYIVQLKKIEVGTVANEDALVTAAKRELSQSAGREFAEQLRTAIRAQVGVERNADAVKALAKTLTGGAN